MRQIKTNCRKVFKGQCPPIQTQVFQMFNGMQVNRQRKLSPIEGAYNYSSLTADQRFQHFEQSKQVLEKQQQTPLVHKQDELPNINPQEVEREQLQQLASQQVEATKEKSL